MTSSASHRTPRAELHVHLLGCLPPSAVLQRLRARGLSDDDEATFRDRYLVNDEDAGSFPRFQAKFDHVLAAHERTDPAGAARDLEQTGRDALALARAEGLDTIEYRLRPPELEQAELVPTLERLLAVFAESKDVDARLALSLSRADPWPDWDVARALLDGELGERLVAVDFCFVEQGHPPKDKREFLDEVGRFNEARPDRAVAVLYHVGESFSDKSLESAARWVHEAAAIGCHRLGHAIALSVDPSIYGDHVRSEPASERRDQIDYELEHAAGLRAFGCLVDEDALVKERDALTEAPPWAELGNRAPTLVRYDEARRAQVRARQDFAIERVRASGAVVEVCPTSNRLIGGLPADCRPWLRLDEAGVPLVVGADDPGIFGTNLAREFELSGLDPGKLRARAWTSRSEALVR